MAHLMYDLTILYTHVALRPPLLPMVRDPITTPFSVLISWIVPSIVNGTETYTVQYGADMTLPNSRMVNGSMDLTVINEMFTVNITGLIPFTTYYYTITANNSVNATVTPVMNFTTDETGTLIVDILWNYLDAHYYY